MLRDIVEVRVIEGYRVYLRFEDGLAGELDLADLLPSEGIFSKLKDPQYFSTVYVDPALGTIVWDNGADLSPAYLYSLLKNAS